MRRGLTVAGGAAWALGVLVCARPPSAGAGWRVGFVAFALLGAVWTWRALRTWRPSVKSVIAISILLRAIVFPLPPSLSDDGYRYLWDGRLQVGEGISPYALRPSDPALAPLHSEPVYERMNSSDYFSVYPPLSQAVFAAAAVVYGSGWRASWWALKGIVVAVELAGIALLIRVVGAPGAALYAWHPLAVIEGAGQGHTEALLVGALGLLLWATARRSALAGASVALAGWVKLWPFALGALVVPWAGGAGRARALAAGVVVAAVLAAPYASVGAATHVLESLRLYAGTFDFYSAPYRVLKSLVYHRASDPGGVASTLLAGLWAGWVLALVATNDGSRARGLWSAAALVAGFVLASPTLHPWHLLPALFIMPLLQNKKPIAWMASISLATYLAYVWPPAHDLALWAGWGGAAVVWAGTRAGLQPLVRRRAWGKWRKLQPHVPAPCPGARFLDLGAGEGTVGAVAAESLGVAVTGVDVVRYGDAGRPVDLYDGRTLPYADGQFDATLVVFVLHHSEDPAAVLREAVRVTSGAVLVLETVWTARWQKPWLERVDRLVNRLRSGAAIDEAPLDIRSDDEWRRTFEREGIVRLASETFSGLHPQALYVLEGQGAAASNTSATVAVRASSQTASS